MKREFKMEATPAEKIFVPLVCVFFIGFLIWAMGMESGNLSTQNLCFMVLFLICAVVGLGFSIKFLFLQKLEVSGSVFYVNGNAYTVSEITEIELYRNKITVFAQHGKIAMIETSFINHKLFLEWAEEAGIPIKKR